jgi:hypothetical protein
MNACPEHMPVVDVDLSAAGQHASRHAVNAWMLHGLQMADGSWKVLLAPWHVTIRGYGSNSVCLSDGISL